MTSERHKQERVYHGFGFTMPPGMSLLTNKQLLGFNWFRVDAYVRQPKGYYAWETRNFYIEEDVEVAFQAAAASLAKDWQDQPKRLTLETVIRLGKLYPGMKFVVMQKDDKRPALYLEAHHESSLLPFQDWICYMDDDMLSSKALAEFRKSWFRAKYWLEDQEELMEA